MGPSPVAPRETTTPPALDAEVARFGRFSDSLVLIEPCSLPVVRRTVEEFAVAVTAHCQADPEPTRTADDRRRFLADRIRGDHRWFETSVEQLRWFLGVVVRDDHGGHRQALGQYGRLFTEALRRHREDERQLAALTSAASEPTASNRN